MGACNIKVYARGKSIQDAFNNACEEAREEYGSDSYNGQINNCELIKDVTSQRNKFPEEDHFEEWILSQTNKRDVYGYCVQNSITNKNKTKTQVLSFPNKSTRKWKTVYQAKDYDDRVLVESATQTQCIKEARAYVDRHNNVKLFITVAKVLDKGQTKCAEITYKKASNERNGSYVFVGFAPE